ncbi:hypothetical protein PT2222_10491 [Paraburkholderia tropica]
MARQVQIDVLQVVGSGPTDTDLFHEPAGEREAKPATITTFPDRRYGLPTVFERTLKRPREDPASQPTALARRPGLRAPGPR